MQFTRQISLVVIAALTFSLIESLLILPAHLAHIKPQQPKGISGGFIRAQASLANTLVWFARNVYGPFLAACIRQRYATLAVFVGLFGLAVVLMNTNRVPFHFMPEIESDLIQVNIQLAEGTPWQRTEEIRQRLEEAELLVQEAYREGIPWRNRRDPQPVNAGDQCPDPRLDRTCAAGDPPRTHSLRR